MLMLSDLQPQPGFQDQPIPPAGHRPTRLLLSLWSHQANIKQLSIGLIKMVELESFTFQMSWTYTPETVSLTCMYCVTLPFLQTLNCAITRDYQYMVNIKDK